MLSVARICLIALPVLALFTAASASAQIAAPPSSCWMGPSLLTAGSVARGTPNRGSLIRGVQFPAESDVAFTWDFPLGASPNRPWRRWGTEKLVRTLECVLTQADLAHPFGQRVGVADLSRPHGGPFGSRYGGLGHASHQNGLDADVLYPRFDACECAPERVSQIDVGRSQELVNAFVAAGARYVFVSPLLWRQGRLRGPKAVVRPLVHHDDHMHVRLRP
jgi:murein endopeptidase